MRRIILDIASIREAAPAPTPVVIIDAEGHELAHLQPYIVKVLVAARDNGARLEAVKLLLDIVRQPGERSITLTQANNVLMFL